MNIPVRLGRLLAAGLVAAALYAGPAEHVALAEPVGAELLTSGVPSAIDVPAGNKAFLVSHAAGVQIYSCDGTARNFVAPRADVYGDNGSLVATHFGGPTWRARDGSAVVARRVDGVTVDPTAIPWLLLSATSTTAGADGDRLTRTTFIQRTMTSGGLSPAAAECNAATAGTVVEIPYTADYVFWKSTGG